MAKKKKGIKHNKHNKKKTGAIKMQTVLLDENGIAQNNRGSLISGSLGGNIRLIFCEKQEHEPEKFSVVFEVFGKLGVADDGELKVTSGTLDTAVGNMDYKFHIEQAFRTEPGNPLKVYVFNRPKVGIL